MNLNKIATVKSDFPDKFGIPRQSGMTELVSYIEFEKGISLDAFKGLDGYDYIWIIWGFDKAERKFHLTVRPPRLGGNKRVGVFASRSPYRPNPIGLSSVKLLKIEYVNGIVRLIVSGTDMTNGTPVYDIKPYLPFTDSHENVRGGFSAENLNYKLEVVFPEELKRLFPKEKVVALVKILSLDPRPAYQNDNRIYGFKFCDKEIKFTVNNNILTVLTIE